MRLFFYITLLFLAFVACNSSKESNPSASQVSETKTIIPSYVFPYDLDNPSQVDTLPEKLTEISGLSLTEDGLMYAVQDENGSVFRILNKDIEEIPFRKDGDYEGIEVVGEYVYVVKSSGTVYKISNFGTDKQMREDFNDFLDDDHDVEGLSYEKESNCLLLACKMFGKEDNGKRDIYKFDLATNKVLEEPYFSISISEIKAEAEKNAANTESKDSKAFAKLLEKKGDEFTYAPSAIAIHPISGHVYITSSQGKLLLVTDKQGKIIHLAKLDKSVHRQPEGLAFDKTGNLYISNEGKDEKGILYRFTPR